MIKSGSRILVFLVQVINWTISATDLPDTWLPGKWRVEKQQF